MEKRDYRLQVCKRRCGKLRGEEKKRRREIIRDCVFDIEERREDINEFNSIRSKPSDGEEGR